MEETRPGMPHTSPLAEAGSCTLPVCSAIRRSDSLAADVAAVMMFTLSEVRSGQCFIVLLLAISVGAICM